MALNIKFSDKAKKDFEEISKGNKSTATRIAEVIKRYAKDSTENCDVKKLSGQYGGIMRLRAGDYRIFFDVTDDTMSIYKIKHRREAYR